MTIVLTTHYMREAEELCDEIAFIKAGLILARGTAGDLDRKSTRLNSSHIQKSRMPSSA